MVVRHDVALAAVVLEDDAGADALTLDRIVEEVACDGLVGDADDGRADGGRGADGRRVARIGQVVEVACCVCCVLLEALLFDGVCDEPQPANAVADSATANAMASFLDLLAFSF